MENRGFQFGERWTFSSHLATRSQTSEKRVPRWLELPHRAIDSQIPNISAWAVLNSGKAIRYQKQHGKYGEIPMGLGFLPGQFHRNCPVYEG